jgi:hypothetical protein
MEPAIMPTKKATATMSIITPTGFGNGFDWLSIDLHQVHGGRTAHGRFQFVP